MKVGEIKRDGRVHSAGSHRGRPRKDAGEIHGNIRTYERGCRCDPCKDVNRRCSKAYRDHKKQIRQATTAETLKTPLQRLKEQWAGIYST